MQSPTRPRTPGFHLPFRVLALTLALGLQALPAGALEFGAEGMIDNLQFPWSQETASTSDFTAANYIWGAKAYFSLPLGADASLMLSYERDPVLRNMALLAVRFERGITRISVGPFAGFLNSANSPFNLGLSTEIRFQWPGVAFASIKNEGALSIGMLASALSAEPQARAEISAGVYTKNSIFSATVTSTRFSTTDAAGLALIDKQDRYMAKFDLFKKNVPYTLLAEAGYETRSKYYEAQNLTDTIGSVIIGVTATILPSPGITLKTSLESSVFTFGLDNLLDKSPASSAFLFRAGLGVYVNTDELRKTKGGAEKK